MRLHRAAWVVAALAAVSGCARTHPQASLAPAPPVVDARGEQLDKSGLDALERGITTGRIADGKVIYTLTLADDAARFASGRSGLSPQVQAQLTALANQLRGDNRSVYMEIQGHTDSVGSADRNRALGLKRAEAVRRFLNRQGVAMNRMASISYGEEAPVASNADEAGRAANRRVVIVILS